MIKRDFYLTTLLIIFSGIMCGCIGGTTQKSVYYVFNPVKEPITADSPMASRGLGVGPINLPDFLDGPQIVTRQEENLLNINEFHRWADSLKAQITDTLVDNLSAMLNTPNVVVFPWERPFIPEYQLYIDFRQFEGKTADSITLEAVWSIVDTNDSKRLLTKRTFLVESTHGEGYKAYVTAMNLALEKLCREIADGVVGVFP
ncbi:MAG: PqiC family protein [Thermodesulfobacteriota bacterium]